MHRKLTITVADQVYGGLHEQIGRGEISHFIENLVRQHVIIDDALPAEYREAADDVTAEREAWEWIGSRPDDALP